MSVISEAKTLLKRNSFVYGVNAAIKSARLSWQSRRVASHYARLSTDSVVKYSETAIREMVRSRMAQAGVRPLRRQEGSLRIFCVGTYYEQENGGFIQALSRHREVIFFQDREGRYGLKPFSGHADDETIRENSERLIAQIDEGLSAGPIDVVIGTMMAQNVSVDALRQVRARGIPVVNIAMDDRLADHWKTHKGRRLGAIGLIDQCDLVLQTTKEYLGRYLIEGCPVLYWPFGSDPDIFKPAVDKNIDVCFVGNNYGWRSRLIAKLSNAGITVACFGTGFPNGHISAAQAGQFFGRSRIILGVGTVGHSKSIVTLKLRDFDGPMSGGLYLTTENPDLRDLYVIGKEIDVYSTVSECIEKVRYYLAHDDEREKVAEAGRRRALRDHTWDSRMDTAFGMLCGAQHD